MAWRLSRLRSLDAPAEVTGVTSAVERNRPGWARLSGILKENRDVAKVLGEGYVLVLIDVDQGHNADVVKKYGRMVKATGLRTSALSRNELPL